MADEKDKQTHTPDDVSGSNGTYDKDKNTSTGVGAGDDGKDYASVFGTGSIVFPGATAENSAYQDYLKRQGLDIHGTYEQAAKEAQQAYAAQVAANKSAYERQLGTYGAQAEMLAKSGLAASGYSDYLAGQAYATQQAGNLAAQQQMAAQQQSALESAQSTAQEQYANYLSQVNTQAETIYEALQSTGGTLSDEAKKYYETLGYSPEAITKAETLYEQYTATPEYKTAQAQGALTAALQGTSMKDILSSYGEEAQSALVENVSQRLTEWANEAKDMDTILSDLGYNTDQMDDESKTSAFTNLLSYADEETKSKALQKELDNAFFNADRESDTERMNIIQNEVKRVKDLYDRGIIGDDLRAILAQKTLDKLGVSMNNGKLSYTSSQHGDATRTKTELVHPGKEVTDYATKNKLDDLGDNTNVAKVNGEYYVKGYTSELGKPRWYKLEGLGKSKYVMDAIVEVTQSLNVPLVGQGAIGKQGGDKIYFYNAQEYMQKASRKEASRKTASEHLATTAKAETAPAAVRGDIEKAQKEYREMIFREMGYDDPSKMTETEKILAIKEWAEKQQKGR